MIRLIAESWTAGSRRFWFGLAATHSSLLLMSEVDSAAVHRSGRYIVAFRPLLGNGCGMFSRKTRFGAAKLCCLVRQGKANPEGRNWPSHQY